MKKNHFAGTVTLDPNAALIAWHRLGSSTWPHEIAGWPALLHFSLHSRLKKEQDQWQKMMAKSRT